MVIFHRYVNVYQRVNGPNSSLSTGLNHLARQGMKRPQASLPATGPRRGAIAYTKWMEMGPYPSTTTLW